MHLYCDKEFRAKRLDGSRYSALLQVFHFPSTRQPDRVKVQLMRLGTERDRLGRRPRRPTEGFGSS